MTSGDTGDLYRQRPIYPRCIRADAIESDTRFGLAVGGFR